MASTPGQGGKAASLCFAAIVALLGSTGLAGAVPMAAGDRLMRLAGIEISAQTETMCQAIKKTKDLGVLREQRAKIVAKGKAIDAELEELRKKEPDVLSVLMDIQLKQVDLDTLKTRSKIPGLSGGRLKQVKSDIKRAEQALGSLQQTKEAREQDRLLFESERMQLLTKDQLLLDTFQCLEIRIAELLQSTPAADPASFPPCRDGLFSEFAKGKYDVRTKQDTPCWFVPVTLAGKDPNHQITIDSQPENGGVAYFDGNRRLIYAPKGGYRGRESFRISGPFTTIVIGQKTTSGRVTWTLNVTVE